MTMTWMRRCAAVLGLCLVHASVALAQVQETVIYYHTDAIGSVRMITDESGQVIARYDYLPFGEPCGVACGPVSPPEVRQFAGEEKDPETSFDYVGARYYASGTGRFTSVDPGHVGARVFDPQSWNGYAYARNNPLRFIDPFGLEPCPASTNTSTCVEGRAGTGEFVFDYVRWRLEALFRMYWDWRMQEPEVMGGSPFAPPIFRGAVVVEGAFGGIGTRAVTNVVP